MKAEELTAASLETFKLYAADAGNWSGEPMVSNGYPNMKQIRGNLSDLVKKGLVGIFKDEGVEFLYFTDAGKAFAAENGIRIGGLGE